MRSTRARVGVSVTFLWALLGALMCAVPASAEDTDEVESAVGVEQIAAQLERDPIFVQQVVGSGDVEAARRLLRETVADLPYPVYVVAGRLPTESLDSGGPKTFAFQLRRLLGKDAVFAIASIRGGTVIPLGEGLPEQPRNYEDQGRLRRAMYRLWRDDFRDHEGNGADWSEARPSAIAELIVGLNGLGGKSMTDEEIENLAGQRFLHTVTADIDDYRPEAVTGGKWMRGTTVGFVIAVWLPALLLFLTRQRSSPGTHEVKRPGATATKPVDPTDWAVGDQELEKRRTTLSRALSGADPERLARRELYDDALAAKEAADTCADSTSQRDRLGALTLVEYGIAAARGADDKKPYTPWRPCFMNPRHGRATAQRQWVFGDAEIRVPLCRACARRMDNSAPAQPLLIRDGRRIRPYFEVDDIWGRTGYGSLIADYPATVLRERAR